MRLGIEAEDRQFWMMQGMARTLGVNLTGAMARGRIDRAGYVALMDSCRGCGVPEACEVWMAEQARGARAAPEFCRGRAILDRLAADGQGR